MVAGARRIWVHILEAGSLFEHGHAESAGQLFPVFDRSHLQPIIAASRCDSARFALVPNVLAGVAKAQ
jgi:hypothetical protein